jgi:LysR family transcriptional activator of mexEF-oprN operon
VCVFNPQLVKVKRQLSLAQYLRYPHVITSFSADLRGFIDEQLEKRGLHRRVVFSSPNFATSPFIVQRMPALTTVPTFIAAAWRDALGLEVRPLPFPVPEFQVSLLWTAANEADAGLRWLRSVLAEVGVPSRATIFHNSPFSKEPSAGTFGP